VGVDTIATFETAVSHRICDWAKTDELVLDLVLKAAVPAAELAKVDEVSRGG